MRISLPPKQEALPLETVVTAHCMADPTALLEYNYAGRTHSIKGKLCRMVALGQTEVILLTRDSTPENGLVSPEALPAFQAAMQQLIERGTKFYTLLHASWATPAFEWSK